MIHLLVIALLAVSRAMALTGFDCPPAHKINPCECFSSPLDDYDNFYNRVQCDDVTNFATIRSSLEGKFNSTPPFEFHIMPRLRLTNMHISAVPARALGNVIVSRLVLSDSDIRRIEKDAFEGQSMLGVLVLANNRFEDIPTKSFQNLRKVQVLSLEGNFLMRIPDRAFENINNLMSLVLSENRISEIDKNAFPKKLSQIFIERNFLSTFNGSLNGLERLEEILANDNRIVNIRGEFDDLPNLKKLYLDRNDISDISDTFLNLTSLIRLSLSGNRITDVGKSLMNLSKLMYLNLSYNYIKELHWTIFVYVKELVHVDLSGNYLTAVCPNRKSISTSHHQHFMDTLGLTCFRFMKFLRVLDLSRNRLVNIDEIIGKALPSLRSLRLEHNQLSTLQIKYDEDDTNNLGELDISFNNFTTLDALTLYLNRYLGRLGMEGNPWICTRDTAFTERELKEAVVAIQGLPDCSTKP